MVRRIFLLIFLLTGCAVPGSFLGLDQPQIEALSKIKDAAVVCLKGKGGPPLTGGEGIVVFASVDKGVFASVAVSVDCAVLIDNSSKATTAREVTK